MDNKWIQVSYIGNNWSNITVYVDPMRETAKICSRKCTYWGYHDESEWDEHEEVVSIERALVQVYPDEKAISAILSNTRKDYSETLKQLAEKQRLINWRKLLLESREELVPAEQERMNLIKKREALTEQYERSSIFRIFKKKQFAYEMDQLKEEIAALELQIPKQKNDRDRRIEADLALCNSQLKELEK